MPEPLLALNTEDRIFLYLTDFKHMRERYVLPHALTQKAIAFAAGIQRKHLSRYLDGIVKVGYLVEAKGHVEGRSSAFWRTTPLPAAANARSQSSNICRRSTSQ